MDELKEQILVFSVSNDLLGIKLGDVGKVIDYIEPVPVPKAAPFVKGIISLHGRIITVIELGSLLGLQGESKGKQIVIIEKKYYNLAFFIKEIEFVGIPESEVSPTAKETGIKFTKRVCRFKGKKFFSILDFDKIYNEVEHNFAV